MFVFEFLSLKIIIMLEFQDLRIISWNIRGAVNRRAKIHDKKKERQESKLNSSGN